VLLETEINPVMTKLIENGLEITAIHNHVPRGSSATFYMHVMATAIGQDTQRSEPSSRKQTR
jgi:hypothetical protein